MSLKILLSEKLKSVKFDEYKFLANLIDGLTEVMDKVNTRPGIRENQQNRFISLTSIEAEAEGAEIIPAVTEVMKEAEVF